MSKMPQATYDEFGNYIGPDVDESDSDSSPEEERETEEAEATPDLTSGNRNKMLDVVAVEETENVEALMMVEDEDAQAITQPLIEKEKVDVFNVESEIPFLGDEAKYLAALRSMPELCRSICLVGDIHHGKTILCDMLHGFDTQGAKTARKTTLHASRVRETKYTDTRMDEQERGVSIKATPLTLLLPDLHSKNYLINLIDTPGHVNFLDEVSAAVRISDGAVLCVDILLGPKISLKKSLHTLAQERVANLVLCITCLDRLVLELRLPPADAYHKIRYVIAEVNDLVEETWTNVGAEAPALFDPAMGNVLFASGQYNLLFTTESFAHLYVEQKGLFKNANKHSLPFDVVQFGRLLWGDVWFNRQTRKFQKTKPPDPVEDDEEPVERTFVDFILNPLYKIISHVIGEEKPTLQPTLAELGIILQEEDYRLNTRVLLKHVCGELFAACEAFVTAIVKFIPSPVANARNKVTACYSGNLETQLVKGMFALDCSARCIVHTVKNYPRPNASVFDVFGRVMSGTLRKHMKVKILGERYSLDDDEDMTVNHIERLWIYEGRFRIEVETAPAGSWVLIAGVDNSIIKTATIAQVLSPPANGMGDEDLEDDVEIFLPLRFCTRNVVRVACEPIAPSELPKMIEGLRKVAKSYPSITTQVEDSGAHVIICAGELAADSALHDLRKLYGDLEIRCADPVAVVCETVGGESTMAATVKTPNKLNSLTMICKPLGEELVKDIEKGLVSSALTPKELAAVLKENYEWDSLASRSLWAFASDCVPSVLVNDILPSRDNNTRREVECIKDFVVHGFQWACREGPLIEEEVRAVEFRLMDAVVAADALQRAGGQVIPTARRAAYGGILSASPRLMEPMLFAEILAPADCVPPLLAVLGRRRGHLLADKPNPATPLETLHALIPAIDSFGFETDVRTHTAGQAFVQTLFHSWHLLPGDPLDTSIVLTPLQPAPAPHLAREFLLKTRRTKGLTPHVSITRFLDAPAT